MADKSATRFHESLRKIYQRAPLPEAWKYQGNLPWADPAFGARMLQEHLDDSHGAASRISAERARQVDWICDRLDLKAGDRLCDLTCGPGLYAVEFAQRGVHVTGVDFAPTSIAYARSLAASEGVETRCNFKQQDIRSLDLAEAKFDAAILLYGQLGVFPRSEAAAILGAVHKLLVPGGQLLLEMLDPAKVDKTDTNWWFTDDSGIWGESAFLHLGERFWDDAQQLSTERFHTIDLATGQLSEMQLNDQTYQPADLAGTLRESGFDEPALLPAWNGLELYDAAEWLVYIAPRT
ncbi:MAG: class I SAM-dependent methyltransferase [Candidatus Binatia bacterium]|nr:class I SAM-dependent methyltransferase [Candidatus Binatia bacterium]MDG2008144.1 class I SAM-dependent methyltransferase [Candidatus Binatia bacterium]